MTFDEIVEKLETPINNASFEDFETNLVSLKSNIDDDFLSRILSDIIVNKYSRFASDYFAGIIEIAIDHYPNIALFNHPENPLFKLAVVKGSKSIYDSYIEKGVIPFLANVLQEEHGIHYMELLSCAESLSEDYFKEYVECVKGQDYNGAFGTYEKNENVALIRREDYETLESVTALYNTIIGRREILKDLNIRAGI